MQKIYAFRDEQIKLLVKENGRMGEVTSVNITMMNCGVQANVIPDVATMTVDIRVSPKLGMEAFEKILKDWISEDGVEVHYRQKGDDFKASPSDEGCTFWLKVKEAFSKSNQTWSIETFPGATGIKWTGLVSRTICLDSRYVREIGIPAYGISPFTKTPLLLHDHNEYLGKDEFLAGIRIYERLIKSLTSK